jgi:hypothetical protein
MLTTLPAWALAFGIATERAARSRLGLLVVALLVVAALVSLRFSVYGGPLGGLL